jgi:hypothetical protein
MRTGEPSGRSPAVRPQRRCGDLRITQVLFTNAAAILEVNSVPSLFVRLFRLLHQTAVGQETLHVENPLLSWVDRMHFQHVLFNSPEEMLQEPFLGMRREMRHFYEGELPVQRPIAQAVDRLVEGIVEWEQLHGRQLPYVNSDALWRRIAFAMAVIARADGPVEVDGEQVVVLEQLIMKVIRLLSSSGRLLELERFVVAHGFEYGLDESQAQNVGS